MNTQTFKLLYADPGYCRVYYRGSEGGLYCIQNDGSWGGDNYQFYTCSRDGEPSSPYTTMPDTTRFDTFVLPESNIKEA